MAKVKITSTKYFTSLKKRFAAENNTLNPVANKIKSIKKTGTHSSCTLKPTWVKIKTTTKKRHATAKSASCDNTAEMGNISLGKFSLVTRLALDVRLKVP